MPHRNRPRRGTLQFWPRKRARRIYPRIRYWPESKEAKPLGFAGWKAGMTHVQAVDTNSKSPTYGKIVTRPVTVLDAPSLFVCGFRAYKKTGSGMKCVGEKWAPGIPKDLHIEKKTRPAKKIPEIKDYDDITLLAATQPEKSGMHKTKPEFFELGLGGDKISASLQKIGYAESVLGKEISAKDVFKPGEFVDASAVTKGFGYTGPVKRFNIRIQTRKDKQMHRHVGSIGSTVPRKVDWRVPQAGQHGFHSRTEFNKRIMMIDDDPKKIIPSGGFVGYGILKSFMLIEGSVPGPRKRLVRLRKAFRRHDTLPVDMKAISLESKQGK
ncbi:MAG: 50S ribosomal protein L3 [Candidatus Aenigmarchaeota archaeon]|nr:50S ribosomal protein L3 [Candidatus Aenigmarchaeota archaeon]MDI6722295.1 50S ribosomal protein L3 [Candidatus Aenigmarchaeota archaeon]